MREERDMGGSKAGIKRLSLLIGAIVAVLALTPTSAFAVHTHPFKEVFGSANKPEFQESRNLAIDPASGDLLVVDRAAQTLTRWKPDGKPDPFSALGANVIDAKKGSGGKGCAEEAASCDTTPQNGFFFTESNGGDDVAVAPPGSFAGTAGDIYVAQQGKRLIDVFASDGHFLGQITKTGATKFELLRSLAVDSAGALFVSDIEEGRGTYKYVPSANPPLNTDVAATLPAQIVSKMAIGVGPTAGYLFGQLRGETNVSKIDANTGAVAYVIPTGDSSNVAIDPSNGHLFTNGVNGTLEYDASGASSASLLTVINPAQRSRGLTVDASGNIYISLLSPPTRVDVYGPTVIVLPDVAIPNSPAPIVSATGATVYGTVNPDGKAVTECVFEYITNVDRKKNEDEKKSPFTGATLQSCAESPAEIGSGSGPVAVHADISGLQPGVTYSYGLRAASADGSSPLAATREGGGLASFTTLTPAITEAATELKFTSATLNAKVNPDGALLSECLFEYGPSESYGQSIPCAESPAEIGTGTSPVSVHANVSGLSANTGYHFRVRAVAPSYGSFAGKDEAFTTPKAFALATGTATNLGASTATLNGAVTPGGEATTECLFEYGPTESYGQSAPCAESSGAIGSGNSPVPVHADVSGLQIGSAYHFRLRAANPTFSGQGEDKSFRTLGPSIEDEWADSVVHTEATLKGKVNPGGDATTFVVEYGETEAYGQSTEATAAGSDSSSHTVSAFVEELQPGTTYHYRFLATSHCEAAHPLNLCTAAGPDLTFTTYLHALPSAGCPNEELRTATYLADCRAYEMVSPLEKNGADIIGSPSLNNRIRGSYEQAASDGEKITYSAGAAFGDEESSVNSNQYLSTRTAAGWITHGINPPVDGNVFAALPFCVSYNLDSPFQAFSDDLSTAWVLNSNLVPLAPGAAAGFGHLYRQDNATGTFEALTIGEPAFSSQCTGIGLESVFQGASTDLSGQFFDASAQLVPAAAETAAAQVYELTGGALRLVSVLPDGSAAAGGSVVGTNSFAPGTHKALNGSVKGAVSDNGSRLYWSTETGLGQAKLYLRLNPAQPQSAISGGQCTEPAKACTIPVSSSGNAEFWAANPSGSEAIYTEGEGLYRFDATSESSAPIAGESKGILGASEDLSRLYFVSREALAAGAVAGQQNLYLEDGGAVTFIAILSRKDLGEEEAPVSAVTSTPFSRDSRVSPDGRHLAFMSNRSLTGYDNTDAKTGKADMEAYVYEAGGELRCASCNPSGARPAGRGLHRPFVEDPQDETTTRAAAWIPTWEHSLHESKPLSDDGTRLFFNSYDALLPTDTNSAQDVYEWEAPGAGGPGGCHEGDWNYFQTDGGCISLISSGQNRQESELVDASTNGRDVFFRTAASLDPRDEGLLDIYDARGGGGIPILAPPAACEGEACSSPPEPPNDSTPSSATFEGAGNVREEAPAKRPSCAKGKVRRHGKCVAKHRKRAHRRAKRNRRAGR